MFMIHQAFKFRYVGAIDYCSYQRSDRYHHFDDSVSHYIPEAVKTLRL